MAKKEKTDLKKGTAQFTIVGYAKVNDYTFDIDKTNQANTWQWNKMNLGVDTVHDGVIFSEIMSGFNPNGENVVYVHGKKKNDKGNVVDDYQSQWKIDFDDRLDEDLFEEIGDNCFFTVGLEKDAKGKTYYKKFLSAYDGVEYIKEHLTEGMTVRVNGDFEYSEYDGRTQCRKQIKSVVLSNATEDKFGAFFTQTILIDADSVNKLDKETMTYGIDAYVMEYIGSPKVEGTKVVIKKTCVFPKHFKLEYKDDVKTPKLIKKLFGAKKDDVWEVVVEGRITRGATLVTATIDDLPDDIKELIEFGALTEEEALEKCVGKGNKPEVFMIKKPKVRVVEKDGVKTPVIEMTESKYNQDDYVTYAQLLENAGIIVEQEEETESSDDDEEDFDLDALLDEE